MKICIATAAIGKKYRAICAPATRSKQRYAQKHEYDFVCQTALLDSARPPAWSKILLVQKLLPHYDWVFWMDADTLVMNDQIRLENLIDSQYIFIGSEELSVAPLNTGVFLVKNNPLAFQLLKDIYAQTEYIHHLWWENAALIALLQKEPSYQKHITLLPTRKMNAYHPELFLHGTLRKEAELYQEGDFVLHLLGVRGVRLFFLMRKYGGKKPFYALLLFLAKAGSFLVGLFHRKGRTAYRYFQQL